MCRLQQYFSEIHSQVLLLHDHRSGLRLRIGTDNPLHAAGTGPRLERSTSVQLHLDLRFALFKSVTHAV